PFGTSHGKISCKQIEYSLIKLIYRLAVEQISSLISFITNSITFINGRLLLFNGHSSVHTTCSKVFKRDKHSRQ
ncbi:unnamed protein product, partial [Rotaria sordida]